MIAFALFASSISATALGPCAPADIQAALRTAIPAMGANDPAKARIALAPIENCPVDGNASYIAHVMRADIAAREQDWVTARAMLANVAVHPEHGLSALAGAIRLRADQGLGDAPAFAADRAALLAAQDGELARAGRKVESFRTGAARVDAYQAEFDQGGFHRMVEFVVTPDDTSAYPVAIMLTDDRTALQLGTALAKPGQPAPAHVWFVDLYTCGGHSTLGPVKQPLGADAPDYAEVKAKAVAALADGRAIAATPPLPGACPGAAVDAAGARPALGAAARTEDVTWRAEHRPAAPACRLSPDGRSHIIPAWERVARSS
ncbi:hypothetical protein [Sphingomonas nostoxanthinifaciens]|uniref:hypothetical protein n=1 Tax=Sphingomonas nostoxanthinifaciens TaxID=2872652 RepID=UPI001CC215D6|nr:hypothetical protein [Sphingomonas nostoxanthinifaciens]UAK22944.1 hypothetical protein K8P63_10900 [Sphingomonas nostoxanthinifaciens]